MFSATSNDLNSALKGIDDAIQLSGEELKRNDELLDQKIQLIFDGAQKKLEIPYSNEEENRQLFENTK